MIVTNDRFNGDTGLGITPVTGEIISTSILLATTLIMSWIKKRNAQKVAATVVVDEAEPLLAANLAAWQGSTKTKAEQDLVLSYFDQIWAQVVSACRDPQLGSAGQRCISDRSPGGKHDWFSYYRDPIEDDPDIKDVKDEDNFLSNSSGWFRFDTNIFEEFDLRKALLIGAGVLVVALISDN